MYETSGAIRILIIDSNEVALNSLAFALKTFDDFELIGAVTSCREGQPLIHTLHPHVLIISARLAGVDCLALIDSVKRCAPQIKILVMGTELQLEKRDTFLVAGVSRFLLLDGDLDDIANAIRTIVR